MANPVIGHYGIMRICVENYFGLHICFRAETKLLLLYGLNCLQHEPTLCPVKDKSNTIMRFQVRINLFH